MNLHTTREQPGSPSPVSLIRGATKTEPLLRVGVVTDGIYPYFKGGKEVRFYELLRRIARPGVSVEVFTMRWWDGGRRRVDEGMILHSICRRRSMYAGDRRSIIQALAFAIGCWRLLAAKVDVIDADHMPYLHLYPLRLLAWAKRVPLVVTWHEWWGADYWRSYLGPFGFVGALVELAAARLADHIVVMTAETARRLIEAGVSAHRITLLGEGVDLRAIDIAPATSEDIDLLYVGRLISHKNVDLLVRAVAELRDDGMSLSCTIVGAGPEEGRICALIHSLALSDRVRVLGRVERHQDVYSLMKGAKTFVYPSQREGFGLAVLEAKACGTQIITFDHPDNHAGALVDEGRTGFLCPPNLAGLTAAIRRAVATPLSGDEIAADVRHYDWSAIAEALLSVYQFAARRS